VPELPEVETARRLCERFLVGKTLIAYELRLAKVLRDSPIPTLDVLVNQRVLAARRRAKILILDFSGGVSLMIHFKLAGQLMIETADGARHSAGHPIPKPTDTYPHKTTHVLLWFSESTTVYYSDVRQFGWLRVLATEHVEDTLERFGLGTEGVGEPLSVAELAAKLRRRTIPIKTALLDQSVVAGLGNIYVDEALFKAKIHPIRPANSLSDDEIAALAEAIPWALERGIEQGGATIINNRAYPEDGFPQVHGRESEPCLVCGTPIVKTRVGSRGTYYCPTCQPDPAGWVRPPASAPKRKHTTAVVPAQ
jgi:formamidopyrimidine-DNA glycosylase